MRTPFLTTAEARQLVAERFERVERRTLSRGRCYERWTETWRCKDGTDATGADVHAFEILPNGQEHFVRAQGPDIILTCACDSGG
jgi:hypothetical protein